MNPWRNVSFDERKNKNWIEKNWNHISMNSHLIVHLHFVLLSLGHSCTVRALIWIQYNNCINIIYLQFYFLLSAISAPLQNWWHFLPISFRIMFEKIENLMQREIILFRYFAACTICSIYATLLSVLIEKWKYI